MPRPRGSLGAPAPAEVLWAARDELAAGRGNSKPVASGSRARPWLGTRQPGNQLLSNFLAIQRACSEPQFHFPPPLSPPCIAAQEAENTRGKNSFAPKALGAQAPKTAQLRGCTPGAAAVPPLASGGGESRGNLLGPARGLPSSFCSLPGKSSNKAAQTQDTSSFQPCLTAALQARLWPEQLHSGPVWPDPLLQTSAGTHPAEEVVKAPVLEGFPQPRPACCQRSHPEIQPSVVSCCPAKLPGYLLAAPCPQATSAAGDLQRGCSGPLRPNSVSQHPLLSKKNIKSVFFSLFSTESRSAEPGS